MLVTTVLFVENRLQVSNYNIRIQYVSDHINYYISFKHFYFLCILSFRSCPVISDLHRSVI